MSEWQLYVRDRNRNRVAEIDDFQQLDLVLRFNAVGSWVIALPADGVAARYLNQDGCGLVAVRDGATLLSGPKRRPERVWSSKTDRLVVAGVDDVCWIADGLAYPVPTGPPYSAAAHDVRTGACETVMRAYVSANVGPGAKAERIVAGLTLATDAALGATVTGRARFANLLELLQALAIAGGDLGFRIVDMQFQVYQPTDLTAMAVFSSDLGNLAAYTYREEAPSVNYIIVAGGGEGTARTFAEKGDSASIVRWGRIELFRDRRDTTDATELLQTADEALSTGAAKTYLSIEPIDTEALAYGADYNLGDKVSVIVDGTTIHDVLREVHITLTPEAGESVRPLVGTPDQPANGAVPALFRSLRQMGGRLSNLERI